MAAPPRLNLAEWRAGFDELFARIAWHPVGGRDGLYQLAKRAVRPVGGGREHVADLNLAVGDYDAVDEQLGQQPALLEGGGGQPGPDGLAECLDPVGDGAEFQLLPGRGVELALLGEQGGAAAVQVLALAV